MVVRWKPIVPVMTGFGSLQACAGPADSGGLLRPRMHRGGQGRVLVRIIKTTTISILALSLLAGSAVGVVAQEAAISPPRPFTATAACTDEMPSFLGEQEEIQLGPDLTLTRLGTPTWHIAVEASDPDLTGEGSLAMNGDGYWEGPSLAEAADTSIADVMVVTVHFGNAAGAWTGTRYLYAADDEQQFPTDVMRLDGDGAFDGWTALAAMTIGNNLCDLELTGVVLRSAMPETPQVSVE